ncbi:MAG: manganese efflux pump MntP family protein [Oscillospiraceae bacterium]|jgi:putative Mn2+ efflux pump MntP|nr:manganese efflux pump MntP family protein [Oscillospiraceae bacterium]
MNFFETFLIAVALSMDAFAVSVCKGLTWRKWTLGKALTVGLWFGLFQAAMPTIGYFAGTLFAEKITAIDHWVAFVLLAVIGGKMLWEGIRHDDSDADTTETPLGVRVMLPLAIATSIDALATGVVFSMNGVQIASAAALIGVTTLLLSAIGTKIGHAVSGKIQQFAEMLGGAILIILGLKILLEHVGLLDKIAEFITK